MSLYNPSRDKIEHFDSPEAFHARLAALPTIDRSFMDYHSYDDWAEIKPSDAFNMLAHGDNTYLADAEKLLDEMRVEGLLSIGYKTLQSDVEYYERQIRTLEADTQ